MAHNVDATKTEESRKELPMDSCLTMMLKAWRQNTQFSAADDWVFASHVQLGRLPGS